MKLFIQLSLSVVFLVLMSIRGAFSQQLPLYPVSYRIFNPFVFNPAIAGSKDFSSLDFIFGNYGQSYSQVVSGNLRIAKSKKKYFASIETTEFTNIGIGGYVFNNLDEQVHSYGTGVSGSYHIQIDKNALSFLSLGISGKAIFNNYKGDVDNSIPAKETFVPNIDAGIYYYMSSFCAGISITNLLKTNVDMDSLDFYPIAVSRQFIFNTGYKILLSKHKNIVIEPFLIINSNDSLSGDFSDMLNPGLRFYFQNLCIGSYIDDFDKFSFFTELQFTRLYAGAFFEIPYKSAFYKDPVIAEIIIGINLSGFRSGFYRQNHW